MDFFGSDKTIFDEKKMKIRFLRGNDENFSGGKWWEFRGENDENRSDEVELNDWYDIFSAIDIKVM